MHAGMIITFMVLPLLLLIVIITFAMTVRIVPQGQQLIIERLGKYKVTLGAGLNILTPFVDRVAYRLSTKDQILEVPSQDVITKDNALVKVNAICFIKIIDTQKAAYGVENYEQATISLVMTSLRATIGKMDLDESLSSRDVIKAELVKAMADQMTDWGLILRSIEIQDIAPSASMQVAMEQQAAAERHRKAAETQAAGNKQAAVLEAEGIRQSMILKAEGIKQSTILKAEAEQEAAVKQAAAAISLAEGTKKSNELLAEGIRAVDGQSALNYQLSKQYIEALSLLFKSESNKVLIMPPELSQSMGNLINSSFVLGATNELDKQEDQKNK